MSSRKKFTKKSIRSNTIFLLSQNEDERQEFTTAERFVDVSQNLPENTENDQQQNSSDADEDEGEDNDAQNDFFDESDDCNTRYDTSFDDIENQELSFKDFLSRWIVCNNIPRLACNSLLSYINKNIDKTIPVTYMTLLNTPRTTPLTPVPPGEYLHIGIEKAIIMSKFDFSTYKSGHMFVLNMNADGVSVGFLIF